MADVRLGRVLLTQRMAGHPSAVHVGCSILIMPYLGQLIGKTRPFGMSNLQLFALDKVFAGRGIGVKKGYWGL